MKKFTTLEETYQQVIHNILLEKDHRQKMMKFGIPQDVADYLHQFSDKYSIWFANEFNKMEDFKKAEDKLRWIRINHATDMSMIRDWVTTVPNIELKKYNFDNALQTATEWHNSLESRNLEKNETNKIIKKYDDGFYWIDFESPRCREEGDLMGHCGTSGKAETIYSLRRYFPETNKIEGYVTIALSPSKNSWHQAKGKKNSKPKKEYFKYIADILYNNEIYLYDPEYQSETDFNASDFQEYIESNPDLFPDSDEFLSKLEENSLEKKVDNLLNEYKFETLYANTEVYDNQFIYSSAGFRITIKGSDYPVIRSLYKRDFNNKKIIEIFIDFLQDQFVDLDYDSYYDSRDFFEIEDDAIQFSINLKYDKEGCYAEEIICFKHYLQRFKELDDEIKDENYDKSFGRKFVDYLIKKKILPTEEEFNNMSEEELKKFWPEDPRQMKFKFAESFKKYFNS